MEDSRTAAEELWSRIQNGFGLFFGLFCFVLLLGGKGKAGNCC